MRSGRSPRSGDERHPARSRLEALDVQTRGSQEGLQRIGVTDLLSGFGSTVVHTPVPDHELKELHRLAGKVSWVAIDPVSHGPGGLRGLVS